MRVVLVLCALLFAGCGVLDDAGPEVSAGVDPAVYGPSEPVDRDAVPIDPPPVLAPSDAVARLLDGGAIGVVDITGATGVRPSSLDTASDARLEHIEWSDWGASGAVGRGTLRSLDCNPSCADGHTTLAPAVIRLSGVRECGGRSYFASGAVEIPGERPPATYLRAPC
jgi:hypothetical protein